MPQAPSGGFDAARSWVISAVGLPYATSASATCQVPNPGYLRVTSSHRTTARNTVDFAGGRCAAMSPTKPMAPGSPCTMSGQVTVTPGAGVAATCDPTGGTASGELAWTLDKDAGEVASTGGAGEVTIPKSELSVSANVLVPAVVYSASVGWLTPPAVTTTLPHGPASNTSFWPPVVKVRVVVGVGGQDR